MLAPPVARPAASAPTYPALHPANCPHTRPLSSGNLVPERRLGDGARMKLVGISSLFYEKYEGLFF